MATRCFYLALSILELAAIRCDGPISISLSQLEFFLYFFLGNYSESFMLAPVANKLERSMFICPFVCCFAFCLIGVVNSRLELHCCCHYL